jgi:protein tyrosine kinase
VSQGATHGFASIDQGRKTSSDVLICFRSVTAIEAPPTKEEEFQNQTKSQLRSAVDARVGHPASYTLPDDDGVVGRIIANRYLVEEPCERSPSISIYRAQHLGNARTVLLRLLPARARLTREACRDALAFAERAASLPTPHIARTLDVGVVADRWPFIVSEYSRGRTVAGLLAQEGGLGLRRTLTLARQVAGALNIAHRSRLTHGELDSSGIWVESPGGRPEWVRLLDFGVAELSDRLFESTQSGVFPSSAGRCLTDGFGPSSVRSDILAFGSLAYELATGAKLDWGFPDVASHLDAPFSAAGWSGERAVARGFALFVERCLGLPSAASYVSMVDVCADLEALAEASLALGAPPAGPEPPVTSIHAPARRVSVALGGPKVIVRNA